MVLYTKRDSSDVLRCRRSQQHKENALASAATLTGASTAGGYTKNNSHSIAEIRRKEQEVNGRKRKDYCGIHHRDVEDHT